MIINREFVGMKTTRILITEEKYYDTFTSFLEREGKVKGKDRRTYPNRLIISDGYIYVYLSISICIYIYSYTMHNYTVLYNA